MYKYNSILYKFECNTPNRSALHIIIINYNIVSKCSMNLKKYCCKYTVYSICNNYYINAQIYMKVKTTYKLLKVGIQENNINKTARVNITELTFYIKLSNNVYVLKLIK